MFVRPPRSAVVNTLPANVPRPARVELQLVAAVTSVSPPEPSRRNAWYSMVWVEPAVSMTT